MYHVGTDVHLCAAGKIGVGERRSNSEWHKPGGKGRQVLLQLLLLELR